MNTFTRILIATILALILMTGQGFTELASWAASCCSKPVVQKTMSCCHDGACEKHKGAKPLMTIKSQEQACQCAPATQDLQFEKASQLMDGKLQLAETNHPNPVLSLQVADTDAPIWLHRLFYPDKSRRFLEKNSWLL